MRGCVWAKRRAKSQVSVSRYDQHFDDSIEEILLVPRDIKESWNGGMEGIECLLISVEVRSTWMWKRRIRRQGRSKLVKDRADLGTKAYAEGNRVLTITPQEIFGRIGSVCARVVDGQNFQ